MKRLYQNIKIPNKKLVYEDEKRKNSNFWNEGKWNNFIEPLLPKYCKNKTFIEIGSSAGLFLKMAEDKGFRHVIGIESHPSRVKEAELYKKSNKGKYTILHQAVSQDFDFNKLPLAHVTLFSNVHYYFSVGNFSKIVDALKSRSVYCIVVSARAGRITGNARYDALSVRGYFNDWEEIKIQQHLDIKDDPSPRDNMYGISFKGLLKEYNTDELYDKWCRSNEGSKDYRKDAIPNALDDFYKKVLSGKKFDFKDTAYYKYWQKRRPDVSDAWIQRQLRNKQKLAISVKKHGMIDPIYLSEKHWRYNKGKLIDGQHRLSIVKRLGYKSILVRIL